jgi:hypothetical protein
MHLTVGAPHESRFALPAGDARRWADRGGMRERSAMLL